MLGNFRNMFFLSRTIFTVILIITAHQNLFAQKTDQVFLFNGDLITCEIIELDLGKLDCKTSDIGRIKVEWTAIDSIWSDKQFEIHLKDGTIVFTSLDSTFYNYGNYKFSEMIELVQIKKQAWSRIDGNVDLGFTYTKASKIFQFNLDSKVNYKFYRAQLELSASTLFTVDETKNRTDKKNVKLNFKRYYLNKSFMMATTGYDQNTELGIQARYSAGGGVGYNLIYRPSARLEPSLGAIVNREYSTEGTTDGTTNVELAGFLDFRKFSYNSPELDIYSGIKVYASLNDFGRIRGEFDVNVKIEVITDFFIKLTWYYNFDNQPVDVTASQSDWGTTLTLSYTF